jgi:phosphoribosylcarboxyaminoimidazole (NCAIR) mutase
MAIINGIETARLEKNHREQSLKELNARIQALQAAAILALHDPALAVRLAAWRQAQTDAVADFPSDDVP